jgi:hypothetical protein
MGEDHAVPVEDVEESAMHAVVVDVSISDVEQAMQELRERVVPMVSQAPGFVSGFWMEAGEGKGHSVAFFESEEAATQAAAQVRPTAAAGVTIDSVEVREVVAHA